jgi:hypothetical protein
LMEPALPVTCIVLDRWRFNCISDRALICRLACKLCQQMIEQLRKILSGIRVVASNHCCEGCQACVCTRVRAK